MLLKNTYVQSGETPQVWDRFSAARFTSAFSALAAFSFFLTPITFFGVSERPYGVNGILVGGLSLALAFTRLLWPGWSTMASYANCVLGLWMMISPWVFGYSDWLALTVNSVGAGLAIIGFSLFSASFTKVLRPGDY